MSLIRPAMISFVTMVCFSSLLKSLTHYPFGWLKTQPLLAALAENPNLSGLFGLLEDSLNYADQDNLSAFSAAFDRLAAGAEALKNGQTTAISWAPSALWASPLQHLISPSTAAELSWLNRLWIFLLSYQPNRRWTQSVLAASRLGIDENHGLRLRLTGTPVIEQDELLSVREGATVSGMLSLFLVGILDHDWPAFCAFDHRHIDQPDLWSHLDGMLCRPYHQATEYHFCGICRTFHRYRRRFWHSILACDTRRRLPKGLITAKHWWRQLTISVLPLLWRQQRQRWVFSLLFQPIISAYRSWAKFQPPEWPSP